MIHFAAKPVLHPLANHGRDPIHRDELRRQEKRDEEGDDEKRKVARQPQDDEEHPTVGAFVAHAATIRMARAKKRTGSVMGIVWWPCFSG